MSAAGPIKGITEQRYYHAALMESSRGTIGRRWLFDALSECFAVGEGRIKLSPQGHELWPWRDLSFHTIEEGAEFAGSRDQAKLLVRKRGGKPEYDVVIGDIFTEAPARQWLVLCVTHATLARHVLRQLLDRTKLIQRVAFVQPDLGAIVAASRNGRLTERRLVASVTGVSLAARGHKKFRGVRLTGSGILESRGLFGVVEKWWKEESQGYVDESAEVSQNGEPRLLTRGVRLSASAPLSGTACSLTLSQDGSLRLWMRQHGMCLGAFGETIVRLGQCSVLNTARYPPQWREEEGE